MPRFRSLVALFGVLALVQPVTLQNASADPAGLRRAHDVSGSAMSLSAAGSWGYQLQDIEPTVLSATPYDVLVIDYASERDQPFSKRELAELNRG